MKHFSLLLSVFILASCSSTFKVVEAPTEYTTVVEKGRTTGIIFSEDYLCFVCFDDRERFTPTLADINTAERILNEQLESLNGALESQYGRCPVIHENLKWYRRQYFGYIDENDQRILFISFDWNRYTLYDQFRGYHKDESDDWKRERIVVLDGCSRHWQIKINLETEELFELRINGEG